MVKTGTITINSSNEAPEFIDITEKVQEEVKKAGLKDGNVLVFSRHSTAAVVIQETEQLLKDDLKNFITALSPKERKYKHTDCPDHIADQMPNGHSHCQHILLGSSEIIPFVDRELMLGTYQRIFLVELDRARRREIVIQVTGE